MGVNPDMLKMSMKVMKANPGVIKMAQEQMSKMSPEQMQQASDMAAKQMEGMSPAQIEAMAAEAANAPFTPMPSVVDVPAAAAPAARGARDAALVDALFTVAAAMTPTGAVTLDALKALPPLQSLAGDLPDDLSADEIAGCWTDAGLAVDGAADRAGFERAWFLLDDLYDDDLMVEARRPWGVAKA